MKKLWELFATFFKIGLFTFGGGYAMIAIIEDNCAEKKKWITHDDMMNVTVIAESTPGPIAINCATFVGARQAGLLGGICATLGVVLPSFLIIFLISLFLDDFLAISLIANAFRGIKIAVGVLIIQAGVKMIKKMEKTPLSITICVLSTVLMTAITVFAWNFSSISMMLVAGAVSVSAYFLRKISRKEEKP